MYRNNTYRPPSPPSPRRATEDVQRCPICKLTNAMSDLRFLYNPDCYHPICENCLNRLFANGPNQCPYAECHKTLRKKAYRAPHFTDLVVEREVDIRRRVAAVFNQVQDDFESLEAYNAYLEMVEDLTMALVYGGASEAAEAQDKLATWEAAHAEEIARHKKQDARARESSRKLLHAEEEAARQRRLADQTREREAREKIARERREDLDALTSAPTGSADKIMLKKRGLHRREEVATKESVLLKEATTASGGGDEGLTIRGLKASKPARRSELDRSNGPYDPFAGVSLSPTRYTLQSEYRNPWLDDAKYRQSHTVGGFSLQEYYVRSMFEAFSGLGVFVGDEKETGRKGLDARAVATVDAAMASEA